MVHKIKISSRQVNKAKDLYEFKELKDSITKGRSNIYGALGEIVVLDYFKYMKYDVNHEACYDYDLIIDGYKVDVKTKKTTVEPKSNYLCSISAHNTRQKCDFYFFIRIDSKFDFAYMLGYYPKDIFFEDSVFNKKGDIDVNGWEFKADCYNMKIEQLIPFKNNHFALIS